MGKYRFFYLFFLLCMFCCLTSVQAQTQKPKTPAKAQPKPKPAPAKKPVTAQPKKPAATTEQKRKETQKQLQNIVDNVIKNQQNKKESELSFEIDGLLIDETLTKTGHDFYDIFYSKWEAPASIYNYTITIRERPIRGRSFQIYIMLNDVEIFEQNLQPRYDIVEAMAEYAVEYTKNYLLKNEQLKEQIESDDQQGTGLF